VKIRRSLEIAEKTEEEGKERRDSIVILLD
jgi:hypothetical protein